MNRHWKYKDNYEKVHDTHASLWIYLRPEDNPEDISTILSLEPSRIQRNGDIVNGKTKNWPTAWAISSKGKVKSKEVRRHIDWIISQLSGKEDKLESIKGKSTNVVISVFISAESKTLEILLDEDIVKKLGMLGIGLYFDLYT